jgi:hypothetical protein
MLSVFAKLRGRTGLPSRAPAGALPGATAGPVLLHEIKPELGVVFIDVLRLREPVRLTDGLARVVTDPEFKPEYHFCLDVGDLRDAPTRDEITALAAHVRSQGLTWLTGRIALIARTPEHTTAAHTFVAQLTAGMSARTRVVSDFLGALRWFEIPGALNDLPPA